MRRANRFYAKLKTNHNPNTCSRKSSEASRQKDSVYIYICITRRGGSNLREVEAAVRRHEIEAAAAERHETATAAAWKLRRRRPENWPGADTNPGGRAGGPGERGGRARGRT